MPASVARRPGHARRGRSQRPSPRVSTAGNEDPRSPDNPHRSAATNAVLGREGRWRALETPRRRWASRRSDRAGLCPGPARNQRATAHVSRSRSRVSLGSILRAAYGCPSPRRGFSGRPRSPSEAKCGGRSVTRAGPRIEIRSTPSGNLLRGSRSATATGPAPLPPAAREAVPRVRPEAEARGTSASLEAGGERGRRFRCMAGAEPLEGSEALVFLGLGSQIRV